jgi:flagellar basal-body rod protein FlgC
MLIILVDGGMNTAMNIAVSGMLAASAGLNASASNLANLESDGPVPATSPQQPVAQAPGSVYQAVALTQTAQPGGGVTASVTPALPSYALAYDPSAPFANMQGMVAAPNVDPAQEMVNQMTASLAYRANIATFKTAQQMEKTLLDATA